MSNNVSREDRMTFTGVVLESNKGIFKVQVSENHMVTCKIAGKLKMFEIKVIVGDSVEIEVSPYDVTLGRITKRLKK